MEKLYLWRNILFRDISFECSLDALVNSGANYITNFADLKWEMTMSAIEMMTTVT